MSTPTELRRELEENEGARRCFPLGPLESLLTAAEARWTEATQDDEREAIMKELSTSLAQLECAPEEVVRHQLRAETDAERRQRTRTIVIGGEGVSDPIVLGEDDCRPEAVRELVVMDLRDLEFAAQHLHYINVVYFHSSFNSSIGDELLGLGAQLKEVHFGDGFDQSIAQTKWPPSLQTLEFGWTFSQPVVGQLVDLPPRLRLLKFGLGFNSLVEGLALPPHLQFLVFQRRFQQPVARLQLPDGLKGLGLGAPRWEQSANLPELPASLEMLQLGNRVFQGREQIDQVRRGEHRRVAVDDMQVNEVDVAQVVSECTLM
jgi:hypothetical protein